MNLYAGTALLICTILSTSALAHSGRTNAEGCHTNRKTGEYHCHGSSRQQADYHGQDPQTARPVKKKATPKKHAASVVQPDERAVTPPPDPRVQCINSKNLNAYWEPVTRRCLDRTTGRDAAG
ncbi:DUF1283 domain-containing protein [Erwinia sp. PsM31]|uniref:DUF1283 domain-containing protein n=1 Tax=Erwinia sp. PsM31 TaxID=3030535 RepID=UPI00263A6C17|nr:DUF1283 domain-containing protein [Erwinia sp. PsM31]MDN4629203.1 DUF1283 domain-containing protein [Erwinia sp. PsM31]